MAPGRRGLVCAAALVLLLAPAGVRAGQPTDQLRTQIDRAVKVLDDPELKKESKVNARRAAVRKIANDIFDSGLNLPTLAAGLLRYAGQHLVY